MTLTLRQIIASNAGTTRSFRDQVTGCRNPAFFTGRDIRSMSAWSGYYYLLRTDTESETQMRYSEWTCDAPAVNGRKTRTKYTDTRTRMRNVWSNGVTDDWSAWSEWSQSAAATEEAFDGNSCPYKTSTESQSNTKTEYSGWACDSPAVNGHATRHRYEYIQYRYRDLFSNGAAGAWGDWSAWSLTADVVEEAYDGHLCPFQTGTGTRHNYSGWSYSLPTGLGATGTRTRSHSITTWPIYSNGATGAESTVGQPDESQSVSGTLQHMGSSYYCSGTAKQNYNIYRNVFAFSDETQYSANYNVNSGSAVQTPGYCGYVAVSYTMSRQYGRDWVNGPPNEETWLTVSKTDNGVTTDITKQCRFENLQFYDAAPYLSVNPSEGWTGASSMRIWLSNKQGFMQNYPYNYTTISADVYYGTIKIGTFTILLEKTPGDCPLPWPPSM